MLEIKKSYVVDENKNPIAVQIPLDDFNKIEEVIENFGLAKLMEETDDDELLSGEEADNYYQSLKNNRKLNLSLVKELLTEEKYIEFFLRLKNAIALSKLFQNPID